MCIFVQNHPCSSIKLAARVVRPPQSLTGWEVAALCKLPMMKKGILQKLLVTVHHKRRSGFNTDTHLPTHSSSWERPGLSPSCSLPSASCTGLGSHLCTGFGMRSFDLQIRKEEGSRSEAEQTGRETACWITSIKLHPATENPFSFFWSKVQQN